MGEGLIASDPSVLAGKACVRGTRLSVEFLLELAASGATQPEVLRQYPACHRLSHREQSCLLVDVLPAQREQLAASKA